MILTTLYALFSAVGFVVDLAHHQWLPMFCVAVYSALAYRSGEDLTHVIRDKTFTHKFGRAVIALLLMALVFYLSNHPLHLVYATISGKVWVVVGVFSGLIANANLTQRT